MLVRDVMRTDFLTVETDTSLSQMSDQLQDNAWPCFIVLSKGSFVGAVVPHVLMRALAERFRQNREDDSEPTAADIMIPTSECKCFAPYDSIMDVENQVAADGNMFFPVLEEGRVVGILNPQSWVAVKKSEKNGFTADLVLKSLHEGLIVVDSNLVIREFNTAAERLFQVRAEDRIGRKAEVVSKEESPIFKVLKTGEPIFDRRSELKDGRVFKVNFVPIYREGKVDGVIQTFTDVTDQERLTQGLLVSRQELEQAFALTLPNSKVEYKLRHCPEYKDSYDPQKGTIRIKEVIPDGGYRHVVNALKVLADLHDQNIGKFVGIDKELMVQCIIFHDLGKSQPVLKPGDVVRPAEVFEPGKVHAARSAELIRKFYNKDEDCVAIVRHHHHRDEELGPDFPQYLLPMLRLMRLVDGLSAGMTRRDAEIKVTIIGEEIEVVEKNEHPAYNRVSRINLFTGHVRTMDYLKGLTDPKGERVSAG